MGLMVGSAIQALFANPGVVISAMTHSVPHNARLWDGMRMTSYVIVSMVTPDGESNVTESPLLFKIPDAVAMIYIFGNATSCGSLIV